MSMFHIFGDRNRCPAEIRGLNANRIGALLWVAALLVAPPLTPQARSQGATPRPVLTVTRGPYLQVGTPNGITVRWRTSLATDSRVRYGTTILSLGSTKDDLNLTTEHEVKLTGLAFQTRYYYSIGTTTQILEGGDVNHSFLTFPPPGTPRPARFWVIGDAGTGTAEQAAVRDAYAAYTGTRGTDFWLMLGDNAYSSGTDADYQSEVFDEYSSLLKKSVLWTTRGNHDGVYAGTGNDYYDFFTLPTRADDGGIASGSEAYYSFDYGNLHMICLDSEGSDRSPGGAMLTWLANDLAATDKDWVIAFWHHPPYTKGSHDSDDITDSDGKMWDMRQNALPILEAGGVDLVLTGHSHSYERSCLLDGHYGVSTTLTPAMKVDPGDGRANGNGAYHKPVGQAPHAGAVYAVEGSSGHTSGGTLNHPAMITSLEELGSVVIDVNGPRLDARFLNQLGAVRDSFTIIKSPSAGLGNDGPSDRLSILPGRPNPFANESRISYSLPVAGPVRLSVLDVNGRRVRTLVSGEGHRGLNEAVWDAHDDHGQQVPAGVYFVMLEFGSSRWARRVVLEP